ncbi:MAG: sel1 repeat family protein [Planctomycetes bacterium]|nr:sel1 repeat family protein [Planctomycetota bacterium]
MRRNRRSANGVLLPLLGLLTGCAALGHREDAVTLFSRALAVDTAEASGPDLVRAALDYARAAELGHPGAANNLGLLFHAGRGVAQDHAEARRWFDRAVAAGFAGANVNLGVMAFYGQGGSRDLDRARDLLATAASAGDLRAVTLLGSWDYEGAGGSAIDRAAAARWYTVAAEHGVVVAQHRLGRMLLAGDGVEADPVEGMHWLRAAAEAGDAAAQRELARCLQRGDGGSADPEGARAWLAREASGGDRAAQDLLTGLGAPAATPPSRD